MVGWRGGEDVKRESGGVTLFLEFVCAVHGVVVILVGFGNSSRTAVTAISERRETMTMMRRITSCIGMEGGGVEIPILGNIDRVVAEIGAGGDVFLFAQRSFHTRRAKQAERAEISA
jgi:hypothetical protein